MFGWCNARQLFVPINVRRLRWRHRLECVCIE
jgi:hypothetical protein